MFSIGDKSGEYGDHSNTITFSLSDILKPFLKYVLNHYQTATANLHYNIL